MEFFVWLILCNVAPLVIVALRAVTKAYKKAAKAKKQSGANVEEIERTKRFEIKKAVVTPLLAGNAAYFLCCLCVLFGNTSLSRDEANVLLITLAASGALAYGAYHIREIIKANHQ